LIVPSHCDKYIRGKQGKAVLWFTTRQCNGSLKRSLKEY
jgi:hypothetical protein